MGNLFPIVHWPCEMLEPLLTPCCRQCRDNRNLLTLDTRLFTEIQNPAGVEGDYFSMGLRGRPRPRALSTRG